jgi:hypothetical protein
MYDFFVHDANCPRNSKGAAQVREAEQAQEAAEVHAVEQIGLGLQWGEHQRNGGTHTEWFAPCGCAFHPQPFPHIHPCSDEHKRSDLHTLTEEQAIVTAARDWAKAWGKVWGGDESAVNEVNDKSKSLHDAVLDLEREISQNERR